MSTSSNSFFNFETNFHSVFFFNFVFFLNSFFFPLKNKKTSNPTNPPCSVFSVFCCLRLAEEEGGRGRGEPDAQLRSGSQQPRGEGEGGEEM